ncbi:MAG: hypothetical protein Q7R83_00040 [bacterium]|nr:hypothetical protein [bacterium]
MSWLFERREIPSEKNGTIVCCRRLGRWHVLVNGFTESGEYMTSLWKDAIRRMPRTLRVKRILLLGLGGGECIDPILRRFPSARMTAVEWDPVMIELSHTLGFFHQTPRLEILMGDAATVVPTLGKFDLIIFDLYRGNETPASAASPEFFRALSFRLAPNGILLANVFKQTAVQTALEQIFACQSTWIFRLNRVGLFLSRLPADYQIYQSAPAYVEREAIGPRRTLVKNASSSALRYDQQLFYVEKYYGDAEPVLERLPPPLTPVRLSSPKSPPRGGEHNKPRLVIWQPVERMDRPKGWWRSPIQMNAACTGFAPVVDDRCEWSERAKRAIRTFEKQDAFVVEPIEASAFFDAYARAPMKARVKRLFAGVVKEKMVCHGDRVHHLGVKERATGRVVGGFAFLDLPEIHQSYHVTSFLYSEAEDAGAGSALMDAWFVHARGHGIRYLDFGVFWAPGDPNEWKNFSAFKRQFGTRLIHYPKPLIKMVAP